MKPTDRVLDVDSTLAGENVRMGIDTSALQHIISVLTDLYSDPELAVIREYSTNALDAHKDAGNPLPIEVTTPTPLAPFFRVRDYGDGLDADDIRDIYSRYGTSTKRDSNDVVGMLGLGCKSALTYSDQFTLVGTKDGRTVQVSVHRDEDGGGSMTIVSDEHTPDAPSGVEVIVPVKRDNKFEAKARDFFRFWTAGTVLVNGAEPKNIRDHTGLTWLVPDKLAVLTEQDRYSSADAGWVVMGNVPYPLPDDGVNSYNRKYSTVAFVDIGEVNFTPSREALQMTRTTKETVERIKADTKRELTAAMQRTVSQAASPHAAILAAQQAERTGVKIADLSFGGKPIPVHLERPHLIQNGVQSSTPPEKPYLVVNTGRYGRKSGEEVRQIPAFASGRVYFTGFTAQAFSSAKRDKLEAWLDTPAGKAALPNGVPVQMVCVEHLTADEQYWTKGSTVLDWTPIQETKVVKSTVGPSWKARPTGSYEKESGGHVEAGDIDLTVPLLWIRPTERFNQYDRYSRQQKRTYPDGALVLVMPANRVEKFKRDFPHACHWRDYVKKEATTWLDQQDAALIEAAKYQISRQGSALTGLDPTRIADPDVARAAIAQNVPCNAVLQGISSRSQYLDGFDSYALQRKYPDPLKEYPLVGNGGQKMAEHIYLYINAVFNAAHPAKESA